MMDTAVNDCVYIYFFAFIQSIAFLFAYISTAAIPTFICLFRMHIFAS